VSDGGNVSITFRIDSKELNLLRIIAADEGISVNQLVSQTLKAYLEWESVATKAGMSVIQKEILKGFISSVPDDELKRIATSTADSFADALLLMTGNTDLDSLLHVVRNLFKRSGFTIRAFEDPDGKKLVIQHDLGSKWSVFFKTYIERLINNSGHPAKISTTDNILVIQVL
jgi:hypothetical protein